MDANVQMFIDFTGAPADQAAMFLEMTGGNVESAVEIYMSSQGGDGDVPMFEVPESVPEVSEASVPPWWNVIWPALQEPPDAWRLQRLDSGGGWAGGIPQPKNGPCGVIAVVHALVLAKQYKRPTDQIQVCADDVASVIGDILLRCREDGTSPVRLCKPKQTGQYGPAADLHIVDISGEEAVRRAVLERIADFQGPGGIIDLVCSAVFTRGVEKVKHECLLEHGELPLVPKNFDCWLCSTELLSLLMRGSAMGNVGAHSEEGPNTTWEGHNTVGLLSKSEKDKGVPIADALKNPLTPVWILHGGDHFTVAWSSAATPTEPGSKFKLHHWNGLPPGGPRLAEMDITATKGAISQGASPSKFYKPEPGEIEEVVQADPDDKKKYPEQYRKWRYEVMLAFDRPDLQGEPRPADAAPEPKFDREDPRYQRPGAWRCCLCYDRRYKTMDFNLVPADSPDWCPKCEKPRKECGWSLWIPFDELPPKRQAALMSQYAKKIEPLLGTKWPEAEIVEVSGRGLPDC